MFGQRFLILIMIDKSQAYFQEHKVFFDERKKSHLFFSTFQLSSLDQMRRLFKHLGAAFAHEVFQARKNSKCDAFHHLMIERRVPTRHGVNAFLDKFDRLTDGKDFLERSTQIW